MVLYLQENLDFTGRGIGGVLRASLIESECLSVDEKDLCSTTRCDRNAHLCSAMQIFCSILAYYIYSHSK